MRGTRFVRLPCAGMGLPIYFAALWGFETNVSWPRRISGDGV